MLTEYNKWRTQQRPNVQHVAKFNTFMLYPEIKANTLFRKPWYKTAHFGNESASVLSNTGFIFPETSRRLDCLSKRSVDLGILAEEDQCNASEM